jgi:hypothetical protein
MITLNSMRTAWSPAEASRSLRGTRVVETGAQVVPEVGQDTTQEALLSRV